MSKTLLTICLALTIGSGLAAQAKPNFSGTWNLDLAKSDFGPSPPPDSMVLVIEHKEPRIKVASTQKSQMGDSANERNLTTDGKPNPNTVRAGGEEQKVTSTSKWDGAKFVTSYTLDMQGTPAAFLDSWELSADGKVLTINRNVSVAGQEFVIRTVFTKK
jgi:hypothetical protein